MQHPAATLRRLLASGTTVQAPGAYDGLSARLVERAGFAAIDTTGFGATATRLGQPDTGYGGPSNIERTVREYVQAGVAAIHLEHQVAPKRCGGSA